MRVIKTFLILALFLAFASLVVPAETSFPPSIPRYRVALTFDDGPRLGSTEALQAVLRRHDVRATFFVVGERAHRYPDLIRSLNAAGHELAGHSWSHGNVRKMRPQDFKMELDLTRLCLQQIIGKESWFFRPPGGTERFLTKKLCFPSRYQMVLWDVHSLDQEGGSPDQIVKRVESRVHDGDVVLLHNGLHNTMQALDILIPHLKARGFEFVTISQLAAS